MLRERGAVTLGSGAAVVHAVHAGRRAHGARRSLPVDNHAALSWKLHRWLWPQLSADEQTEAIRQARSARAELTTGAGTEDHTLRRIAGLPDTAAATAMLASLDAHVWAELGAVSR